MSVKIGHKNGSKFELIKIDFSQKGQIWTQIREICFENSEILIQLIPK